jgi:hypothetical protein
VLKNSDKQQVVQSIRHREVKKQKITGKAIKTALLNVGYLVSEQQLQECKVEG